MSSALLLALSIAHVPIQKPDEYKQGPQYGYQKGAVMPVPVGEAPGSTKEDPKLLLSNKQIVSLIPAVAMAQNHAANQLVLASAAQTALRSKWIQRVQVWKTSLSHTNYAVQTPIKQQGSRGTCCVFSATGAMEARYQRAGRGALDLSEEYTNWIKNELMLAHNDDDTSLPQTNAMFFESLPGTNSAGMGCVGIMDILHGYRTVADTLLPYNGNDDALTAIGLRHGLTGYRWDVPNSATQRVVNAYNFDSDQQPAGIFSENRYGVASMTVLPDGDLHDTDKLETIIDCGYDIPFSTTLTNDPHRNPRDPVWHHNDAWPSGGGHSMLIVGYDHDLRIFLVKNSWGYTAADPAMYDAPYADWVRRFPGYVLMSYDYAPSFNEGGYVEEVYAPAYNFEQRFIGQWTAQIVKRSTGEIVSSGTLTWRRLPERLAEYHPAGTRDLRLGDYAASDGRDYRVNATRIGSRAPNTTMMIDFGSVGTNFHSTSGVQIACTIANYDSGTPMLTGRFLSGPAVGPLAGSVLSDLELRATRLL